MRKLMAALLAGVLTLAGCGRDEVTVKLTVTAKGADGGAVPGANVSVGGRPVGATNRAGTIVVEERRLPGEEVAVAVDAGGDARWRGSFVVRRHEDGEPDEVRLDARLTGARPAPAKVARAQAPAAPASAAEPARAATEGGTRPTDRNGQVARVPVRALTDVFGSERPVAGVRVFLGDTLVGTTNAKGLTRAPLPPPGKKARLVLVADDFVPARWSIEIGAGARRPREIRRFFYPVTPEPIRVGLAGYSASAGAEPAVADGIARLEESLGDSLFARKAFVEVPALRKKLEFVKLKLDDLGRKGWDGTPLRSQLDLLVVGSVAGSPEGPFTIETRVYTPSGRLLLAHVKEARDLKRPRDLTRDLAEEIVARFPFEGTVIEVGDGGRLRVNLGAGGGRDIETGTRFHLFVAEADGEGRVTGRREVGIGTVTRVDEVVSEIKPESPQAALEPGDRVVRALLEREVEAGVVHDELHVREHLRDGPDVAAARVQRVVAQQREALVDADDLRAQRSRLLDHRDPGPRVVEPEALPVRSPLRVDLPRAHALQLHQALHAVELRLERREVRQDLAQHAEPRPALEQIDHAPRLVHLALRDRRRERRRGETREDRDVGVAVHEDLLHEMVARVAAQRVALAAAALGQLVEEVEVRVLGQPRAVGADVVRLHVEDELVPREHRAGRGGVLRHGRVQGEEPAGTRPGPCAIHGQERRRDAGRALEEGPA